MIVRLDDVDNDTIFLLFIFLNVPLAFFKTSPQHPSVNLFKMYRLNGSTTLVRCIRRDFDGLEKKQRR